MATICFGPPPLPPNKRPSLIVQLNNTINASNSAIYYNNTNNNKNYNNQMKIRKLAKQLNTTMASQTYQSFRDQIDQDEMCYIMKKSNENNNNNNKELCLLRKCDCRKSFHRKKCSKCDKRIRKLSFDGSSDKIIDNILCFDDEPKCLKKYKNFENIDQQIENESTSLSPTRRCLKHTKSVCYRKFSATNSLNRSAINNWGGGNNTIGRYSMYGLIRSHSDGNLAKKSTCSSHTIDLPPSNTFNKCLKVLSGSWKNLLHCKYTLENFFLKILFSLKFSIIFTLH